MISFNENEPSRLPILTKQSLQVQLCEQDVLLDVVPLCLGFKTVGGVLTK